MPSSFQWCPSPQTEARGIFQLVKLGLLTVAGANELIRVSPAQERELRKLYGLRCERWIIFRQRVLECFDALAAKPVPERERRELQRKVREQARAYESARTARYWKGRVSAGGVAVCSKLIWSLRSDGDGEYEAQTVASGLG